MEVTRSPLNLVNQLIPRGKQNKALSSDATLPYNEGVEFKISSAARQPHALSLSAREILKKINEKLGISLDESKSFQEATTPEDTASFVLGGVKALLETYKKQTKTEITPETLDKFFSLVEGGINKGYESAVGTLKEIGATDIEGVQKSVEEARLAIDRGLTLFKEQVYASQKEAPTKAT
jgi:hypothetical protein